MKETTSQSEWVGKVVTCAACQRSYEIEPGDEIKPGYTRGGSRRHIRMPRRFDLPCGHIWALPNNSLSGPATASGVGYAGGVGCAKHGGDK